MNNIFDLINNSKSIVLLTHENPDGDAIGSVMAFYNMLIDINKTVDIVMSKIPSVFSYIKNIDKVFEDTNKIYDLGIVLDCANKERIGQVSNVFSRCKKNICIDHHTTNGMYGDVNLVDENAPACAQIIYNLFKNNNVEISKEIGECIATGILTDTNGFKNNNVNKETFLIMSQLFDLNIDLYDIYNKILCKKTMSQHLLMKTALDRLELFYDGKIAFSYITLKDMENFSASIGEHEGLVELGRDIIGVEVSIFLREDDGYNVSFRSNGKIDVNKIAMIFNGGGHKMAAGAKIKSNFEETKKSLINETKKVLDDYEWNFNN